MTKITTPQELRAMMAALEREIRKDELYHAMLTVERLGGASPEETAVIMALGERMQELDGAEYPRKLPPIGVETTQGQPSPDRAMIYNYLNALSAACHLGQHEECQRTGCPCECHDPS